MKKKGKPPIECPNTVIFYLFAHITFANIFFGKEETR